MTAKGHENVKAWDGNTSLIMGDRHESFEDQILLRQYIRGKNKLFVRFSF